MGRVQLETSLIRRKAGGVGEACHVTSLRHSCPQPSFLTSRIAGVPSRHCCAQCDATLPHFGSPYSPKSQSATRIDGRHGMTFRRGGLSTWLPSSDSMEHFTDVHSWGEKNEEKRLYRSSELTDTLYMHVVDTLFVWNRTEEGRDMEEDSVGCFKLRYWHTICRSEIRSFLYMSLSVRRSVLRNHSVGEVEVGKRRLVGEN